MNTLCVLQARMGSTRLPGKVMAELGGRPALAFMLDRLAPLQVDQLVVATSTAEGDDRLEVLAKEKGVAVVRGPEEDVLARFMVALDAYSATHVVRLTGDCPLMDAAVVATALQVHAREGADYTSNTLVRTFPDGLDVEVVTAVALREAYDEAVDLAEREHVTPFVYRRPDRYRLAGFESGEDLGAERWTLDTAADLERIREIVEKLDDPVAAGWRDILAVAGRTR
jgi:spore coat polysaccharide biosynthesis protein SpsF (cytidylyltransferase family)